MKNFNVKRTFALAASALALSSAFVGCSDYSEFSEAELQKIKIGREYDEAFIEKFGMPAEGHTFGMNDVLQPIASGNLATRAAGAPGTVNTQRNMWAMRQTYPLGPWNTQQAGVIARDVKIPGWPNFDGKYYGSNGAGALEHIFNADGTISYSATGRTTSLDGSAQPVGDVTEFEIQYVSAWFRTHQAGTTEFENAKVNLHLSDFFVQNVSVDNDQDNYGSLSNGTYGTNGNNLKRAKDFVGDDITKDSNGWRTNRNISRRENSNEELNYRMDQLQFKAIGGQAYGGEGNDSWTPGSGWTHINNFNNQNSNYDPEMSSTNPNREIKYVTSAGTEDFACKASMGNHWMNDWVLVRLVWEEDGIVRVGYYLAFDFNTQTNDTRITGDGYYSNWIIKITPAHFNPESDNVRRVMCEDLGGAFDFDFNDVVFDVAFASATEAIISIQAAGGTLPIIIGQNAKNEANNIYEIHNLLDNVNGEMKPINVGDYRNKYPNTHIVSNYRVPVNSNTVNKIDIWVKNIYCGETSYSKINLGSNERTDLGTGDERPSSQFNPSSTVKAPRAFAVPLNGGITIIGEGDQDFSRDYEVQWMQEQKSFPACYYWFNDWIKDPTKKFGLTTDTGEPNRKWYEQNIGAENLFTKKANPTATGTGITPSAWRPCFVFTSTNLGNDPLAYAHSMLQLDAYQGQDPIWSEFKNNNAQMMTHTIVFETDKALTAGQTIEAILIPADIETSDGKTILKYKGGEFVTYSSEEEFKNKAITGYTDGNGVRHDAVFTQWQPAVHQEGYENPVEGSARHIYTCRFSFSRNELMCTPDHSHTSGLMQYLLLYVKAPSGVTVTVPKLLTGDNPKWEWYIHY